MPSESTAIVIGASGGLGSALCQKWQQVDAIDSVVAVSRQAPSNPVSGIQYLQCDYSEASIIETCKLIKSQTSSITRVCICNGILHNDHIWPEKRIEDIRPEALQEVISINTIVPILWLKALLPLVKGSSDCIITVFSARIGSITDNRSGGWYSYRASKAALNMLLKTASIEFARRAKNVKLIAFQPGATDTALSRPFQKSVKPENLLAPRYVAQQLVSIMNHQAIDGKLSFIDYEGNTIDW